MPEVRLPNVPVPGRVAVVGGLLALAVLMAACVPQSAVDEQSDLEPGLRFATTSGSADGNRYVEGTGAITPDSFEDIAIDGSPRWIVAIRDGSDIALVVSDSAGALTGFTITDTGIEPRALNLERIDPETPPSVVAGRGVLVSVPPASTGSVQSSSLALETGGIGFVASDGAVVISDVSGNRRFELEALVDGRLAVSNDRRLAVLAGATDRYAHGILGDPFEASRVSFVSLDTQEIVATTEFASDVFEGIAGFFADLDSDGAQEFVVTLSNGEVGAHLAVIDDAGEIVAESESIGLGGRWRHQIAVAPFGPNGEIELVDVRTPHIGGTVEFFQMIDGALVETASLRGYSSHRIGSRNVDSAVAADVDGNGQVDLVVPTDSWDALGILQRSTDGVELTMTLITDGTISSNLFAVESADGGLVLFAGLSDGRVRMWR